MRAKALVVAARGARRRGRSRLRGVHGRPERGDPGADHRRAAEIAACADEVAELAERVRAQLRSSVVGDAEAAGELARAAARVARRLAELNA